MRDKNSLNDLGEKEGEDMGGRGSGTYYRIFAKETVEDFISLDIAKLKRKKYLIEGQIINYAWSRRAYEDKKIKILVCKDYLILINRNVENTYTKLMNCQVIYLTYTKCNYGGQRVWVKCPICKGRFGKLYLRGGVFLCRKCADLNYESTRDNSGLRVMDNKIFKLKDKFEMDYEDELCSNKPKGMHKKTFNNIQKQLLKLQVLREKTFEDAMYKK